MSMSGFIAKLVGRIFPNEVQKGNKRDEISDKFKPVEQAFDKMYKECMSRDEEMYFLCHLVLLDDKSNVVDDIIHASGTKDAIQIMAGVTRRQIDNPENYIDRNAPIQIVRVYDYRDKYAVLGKVLEDLNRQHPEIRGYCMLTVGAKRGAKELDSSLFILGEKNILEGMSSFIEQLLATPKYIQDGRFVRWKMTSCK